MIVSYSIKLQTGEYSNGTHCVPCLAGYRCPDPSGGPQQCADGYYQDLEGQVTCNQCPAGQHCLDKAVLPTDCTGGYFSLAGDMECRVSYNGGLLSVWSDYIQVAFWGECMFQ